MSKTINEINEKIERGAVRVVCADEMTRIVKELGPERAAEEVDVVTTGTFGTMCSSGAWLNFGHSEPPIKMTKVWLNDVEAYTGVAAVDAFVGATQGSVKLGIDYGGAHVIEDLLRGKPVVLRSVSYGTDCYPRKRIITEVRLEDLNTALLSNPRNGYQKYNAAGRRRWRRMGQREDGLREVHPGRLRRKTAGKRPDLLLEGPLVGPRRPGESLEPDGRLRYGALRAHGLEGAVDRGEEPASEGIRSGLPPEAGQGLYLRARIQRAQDQRAQGRVQRSRPGLDDLRKARPLCHARCDPDAPPRPERRGRHPGKRLVQIARPSLSARNRAGRREPDRSREQRLLEGRRRSHPQGWHL